MPSKAPKIPLRIVVVGGSAGGMSAATRARRLDETALITVYEKGPYVSYDSCGLPYALGGIIQDDRALILQTPKSLKELFDIDIFVGSEVIDIDPVKKLVDIRAIGSENVTQHRYDKLVLSQGVEPSRPPIEGINLPHVFTLQTIPDLQNIKSYIFAHGSKNVAIIGGGFIGIECADALHDLGLDVSIIEYTSHVFPLLDPDITEPLQTEIRRNNINLLLNARIQRIEPATNVHPAQVIVAHGSPIPANVVIACVGTHPRTSLAQHAGLSITKNGVTVNSYMQTSDPDIYAVGDMVATHHLIADRPLNVGMAGPANRQGRLVADHIFGRQIAYRGNVGTSVCKVFDLCVASTGLSVHSLKEMGWENCQWITIHPPSHAPYYPGSSPITLKLIFELGSGKILGAQAVGKEGVDKRIDVLSTAMHGGMTVFDLEHLELAYSPPFGTAKDPVNIAGFVGSDVLRGDVEVIHAEELSSYIEENEGVQVVDVRCEEEFMKGCLKGAVCLPMEGFRERVGMGVLGTPEKGKGRKVVVYCGDGERGYLACRVLKQLGFEVKNLDGGFKSMVEGGFAGLVEEGLVEL